MNFGLIFVLLILGMYIFFLLYLNSKVNSKENSLSDKPAVRSEGNKHPGDLRPLKNVVSLMGVLVLGTIILIILVVAICVLFFREEFLPR